MSAIYTVRTHNTVKEDDMLRFL